MIRKVCYMFLVCFLCYSCKHQAAQSDVKVVNGVAIKDSDYPAVVQLVDAEGDRFCTGTFISRNTLLTAAHCLLVKDVKMRSIGVSITDEDGSSSKIYTSSILIVHGLYKHTSEVSSLNNRADIGVAIFESDIAPAVMNLAGSRPPFNSEVVFIGFGRRGWIGSSDVVVKTKGTNKIKFGGYSEMFWVNGSSIEDENFFNAGESTSGSGDSGGAVFFDNAIVGVTSWANSQNVSSRTSFFVDINREENRAFLKGLASSKFDKEGRGYRVEDEVENTIRTGINIPEEWK